MSATALAKEELERYLADIRNEPEWRDEADMCAEYYDGNQLDQETLRAYERKGIPPLIRNLIGPTVDLVLGMEARARRDWKVVPQREEDTDLASFLTAQLRDAERMSGADRACSDAYSGQIKAGLGWTEVTRESDPFKAPFRVRAVPREEIFWDFRAREPDLSDARFLVRKKFYDADLLARRFPNHTELIRQAATGWAEWDTWNEGHAVHLINSHAAEQKTSIQESEWRDSDRKRLCLYEVWYRVWDEGIIIRLPTGSVVEFDLDNPEHVLLAFLGQAEPKRASFSRVRLAWWIGPHQLADIASPYQHGSFPYVPWWGYREDKSGAPYSPTRRVISSQDELNVRVSKNLFNLSAKRVLMDDDALAARYGQTPESIREQVSRANGVVILDPRRSNKGEGAFRVESDQQQAGALHMQAVQESSRAIQDCFGVYQAMLGQDTSADSGVAINSLVEQGSTTLAEINDNYRYARKRTGELLLALVKEEIGTNALQTSIQRNGKAVEMVINARSVDETGVTRISNSITQTQFKVDLDEIPASASVRQSQLKDLIDLIKTLPLQLLPPQQMIAIMQVIVKATDLDEREELIEILEAAIGAPPGGMPDMATLQAQQAAIHNAEQDAAIARQRDEDAHQARMQQHEAQIRKTDAQTQAIRIHTAADTLQRLQSTAQPEIIHAGTPSR